MLLRAGVFARLKTSAMTDCGYSMLEEAIV